MKTCDPAWVEAAGFAGFDYAILDREHGPASLETTQNLIRAAQCADLLPVVRVSACDEVQIAKVLDIGAIGVQVPQIDNARQAERAVRAAKYHPSGQRGLCRFVRAARYSATPKSEYLQSANHTLIILQLEGRKAIDNVDEILSVAGIDVIFIGPYDLSQALAVPGDIDHPRVIEQMQYLVEKTRQRGMVVGTFADTYAYAEMWRKAGVQYLAYSVDVAVFLHACQDIVGKLNHFRS
jgi:4-hydroxy-2-oxoheptanedioate aldolase